MTAPAHGLAKRLALGFSGQAFSRLVFAINTVALVPILIHAWGLSGYGQWIALTALASYMSLQRVNRQRSYSTPSRTISLSVKSWSLINMAFTPNQNRADLPRA